MFYTPIAAWLRIWRVTGTTHTPLFVTNAAIKWNEYQSLDGFEDGDVTESESGKLATDDGSSTENGGKLNTIPAAAVIGEVSSPSDQAELVIR